MLYIKVPLDTKMNVDIDRMTRAADAACGLLKVLSNRDRLLLLCQISQGDYCVSDLAALTGIAQPSLSQQLGVLRELELVKTRREGKSIYYKLVSAQAIVVLQVLYQEFCNDPPQ
jgi:DNA-binding transcriptional ArsR family regulator